MVRWSHALALYLFWPAVVVVVWGEVTKDPMSMEHHVWDKLLHFTAYFGLSGLATVALNAGRRTVWAVLGLIAFGGIMEIMQGMVGRDMSAYDEIANALGVVCGAAGGWLVLFVLKRKSAITAFGARLLGASRKRCP